MREWRQCCSAKETATIKGPRESLPAKPWLQEARPALGAVFVLVPTPSSLSLTRETPEVPPSVRTVRSPLLTQAQEDLTAQLALSSSSGRCCHGNRGKASSSEGRGRGARSGPVWMLRHQPGSRRHLRWSLRTSWLLPLCGSHLSQQPCPREPAAQHSPAIALPIAPRLSIAGSSQGCSPPPLPLLSHLCIQPMFRGHLTSSKLCATRWGDRGNKGFPALPELRVGGSSPPSRACLKFQALNSSVRHPPGLPPPKVPTAPHMDLAWNNVTMVPILHQAGGSGAQGECLQGLGAGLPWPLSSAFWQALPPRHSAPCHSPLENAQRPQGSHRCAPRQGNKGSFHTLKTAFSHTFDFMG